MENLMPPASMPKATEITDLADQATMQWIDQFNQHLMLTVQALRHLEQAFDGKLTQ